MLKKEKKRKNIHAKWHERKKCMPKSMKKERNKDSPYFQIKGTYPKRERFMIQRSTKKIFRIRKVMKKIHTLACLDQSV
jgi:uncharacterized protein YjlB